jgi:lipoprotein NlpI
MREVDVSIPFRGARPAPGAFERSYMTGLIRTSLRCLFLTMLPAFCAFAEAQQTSSDYIKSSERKFIARDLDGAMEDINKAVRMDPNDAKIYYIRGLIKSDKGDFAGGMEDFSRAIELNPKDAKMYNYRAAFKRDMGDLGGAIEDCNKAIELSPLYGDAYDNRGYIKYNVGAWAESLGDLRKVYELVPPKRDYAFLYIWLCRSRLGERDAASRELEEYMEKRNPRGGDEWVIKVATFLVGKLPEADFLKAAATSDPKVTKRQQCEAYFYAGSVRLLDGDREKARIFFERCLGTGLAHYNEYMSASAELKRLGKEK